MLYFPYANIFVVVPDRIAGNKSNTAAPAATEIAHSRAKNCWLAVRVLFGRYLSAVYVLAPPRNRYFVVPFVVVISRTSDSGAVVAVQLAGEVPARLSEEKSVTRIIFGVFVGLGISDRGQAAVL